MSFNSVIKRIRLLYNHRGYQGSDIKEKPTNLLHASVEVLQLYGVLRSKDEIHDWFYYARRFCVILSHSCVTYVVFVGYPVRLCLNIDKMDEVLYCLLQISNRLTRVVLINTAMHPDMFDKLNDKFNEVYSFECWTKDQSDLLRRTIKNFNTAMKVIPVAVALVIPMLNLPQVATWYSTREINFPWLPFDYRLPIFFEMVPPMLFIVQHYQMLICFEVVVFAIAAGTFLWAQLKVLQSKLRSISPRNGKTRTDDSLIEPNKHNSVSKAKENSVRVKMRKAKPVGKEYEKVKKSERVRKKDDGKRTRRFLEAKKRMISVEMDRKLSECVKLHQAILGLKNLDFYAHNILFVLFGNYLCGLCLTAVIFGQSETLINNHILVLSGDFLMVIVGIFVVCVLSEMINTEFSAVGEAVYDCDWFNASDSFKRSMRIIISRTHEDNYIYAFGFVTFSLEMFKKLTNQSYSYYTSVMAMHK